MRESEIARIDAEIGALLEKQGRRRVNLRRDEQRILELRKEKERLSLPDEPGKGTVIRFVKVFAGNPTRYVFTAHRDEDRGWWWGSGSTFPQGTDWRGLVAFIKRDSIAPFSFEIITSNPTTLGRSTRAC